MAGKVGKGAKIITYAQKTVYGQLFKCSKRTARHLDFTKERLAKKAKKDGRTYVLHIIQGCFHTGVAASAGTHDYDACLDVYIEGMSYADAQRFLRSCGWAAFWRKPPTFSEHIHMVSLPAFMLRWVARVGYLVPGQVTDYYAEPPKDGLASHAVDPSWHPDPIRDTIFDYADYVKSLPLKRKIQNLLDRRAALRRQLQKVNGELAKSKKELAKLNLS